MKSHNLFLPKPDQRSKRLISLDIFRGLTMFGMLMVDCNGSDYPIWPIRHSEWNGLSTADLVFPNFLFINGLAIPFALNKNMPQKSTWIKIIKRSIILILIGMLEGFQDTIPSQFKNHEKFHFRIYGVLQRIGLCYLFNASLYYGIFNMLYQGIVIASFIILYLGFFYFYNVPDYYLNGKLITKCGVDKWASMKSTAWPYEYATYNQGEVCNFGAYVDRQMLTPLFMYTDVYDPEGLISTFTAFANVYAGILFCLVLRKYKENRTKLIYWWGGIAISELVLAYLLSIGIPFNKKVWSFSFVFVTCGYSSLTQLALYLLVDVWNKNIVKQILQPFVWFGSNPLFIYVLMMFVCSLFGANITWGDGEYDLYSWLYDKMLFSWIKNDQVASTIYGVFWVSIYALVAWILYKNKIYIKL
eukprot:TRINITY_DN4006_c0_g1_i7.p1 TRINITY_DN4006_c0_g1~~TRINITY_DN4006_c0_g1_i7.p1  ORF type:complete len:415 (-),score=49.13 TRINITY_DN4006_c0_g1_i7:207-1451(-)